MKDKVISLNSGEEYYILEELEYNDRKFGLGLKCDLEHDTANEDELELFEISMNDGDLIILDVIDDNLATEVTDKILEKKRKN